MPRIPQMSSREVEKLLLKNGFELVRQKGSHKIYKKESKLVVVPFGRKPLKKGTLAEIFRQAGLR